MLLITYGNVSSLDVTGRIFCPATSSCRPLHTVLRSTVEGEELSGQLGAENEAHTPSSIYGSFRKRECRKFQISIAGATPEDSIGSLRSLRYVDVRLIRQAREVYCLPDPTRSESLPCMRRNQPLAGIFVVGSRRHGRMIASTNTCQSPNVIKKQNSRFVVSCSTVPLSIDSASITQIRWQT